MTARTIPRRLPMPAAMADSMTERLVESRPVMSRGQLMALGQKLIAMTEKQETKVIVEHTAQIVTRMTNGRVMSSDDGDFLRIYVRTGGAGVNVNVETNQLTDEVLRDVVRRCEAMGNDWTAGEPGRKSVPDAQDTYPDVALWHDTTIRAMRETRETLLPSVLGAVSKAGLLAAGSFGVMAKSQGYFDRQGIRAYSEETDSELTVTARNLDGTSSGWGGQAARDWSKINPGVVTARAIDMAKRGVGAQAIEPQRRTAILTPEAVVQIMRLIAYEFDRQDTERQRTAFSKAPRHARYRERMFDPRITMTSDPADPDGGYPPYFLLGFRNSPMTWIKDGVLMKLADNPWNEAGRGQAESADVPRSFRLSGGTTTIEEMIAQCSEGIFVNRFSNVDLLDLKTGMMTGITCDGCFLVKNGKIDRPVKNFRFLDSPFFMLNNILALGPSQRAAFGYTPPGKGEEIWRPEWPRPPIIVPPMMIKDFNFNSLADAI